MSTYTPIASITLSSAQSSVTFSSIPQTYTDLVLVCNVQLSSSGQSMLYQFNGDTATNYSLTILKGNGTSATSDRRSNINYQLAAGWDAGLPTSSSFATGIINIQNYSNATTNKTSIAKGSNAAGGDVTATVNLWRNTNAVTSIRVYTGVGNLASGSTFNLYGIANASAASKATGGDIVTTDGTYWYHTFLSSGTFTPTQSLTADYLVVAGGAGAFNGGGGAGGVRCTVDATGGGGALESPLSLTAQAYTVTVGAGGTGGTWGTTTPTNGSNSVFSTITSTGGGAGGWDGTSTGNGRIGGSGGGAFGNPGTPGTSQTGGSGTANQGYAGGTATKAGSSSPTYFAGAGGGGAGAVGSNSTPHSSPSSALAGNGGVGIQTAISGSATYYGGGGGGGNEGTGNTATGGSGGGGNGGTNAGAGTNGVANTGGGGGGRGSTSGSSANGGSGIVIVRYAV